MANNLTLMTFNFFQGKTEVIEGRKMDYRKEFLRYVKIHLVITQLTFLKELIQEVIEENAM